MKKVSIGIILAVLLVATPQVTRASILSNFFSVVRGILTSESKVSVSLSPTAPLRRMVQLPEDGGLGEVVLTRFDIKPSATSSLHVLKIGVSVGSLPDIESLYDSIMLQVGEATSVGTVQNTPTVDGFYSVEFGGMDVPLLGKTTTTATIFGIVKSGVSATTTVRLVANSENIQTGPEVLQTTGNVINGSELLFVPQGSPIIVNKNVRVTSKANNDASVTYTADFSFTLVAGNRSLYIPQDPYRALAISTSGTTRVTASLREVIVAPEAVAGDTSSYFVVPAGSSRSFDYSGPIDIAPHDSARLRIAAVRYGFTPQTAGDEKMTFGIEDLVTGTLLGIGPEVVIPEVKTETPPSSRPVTSNVSTSPTVSPLMSPCSAVHSCTHGLSVQILPSFTDKAGNWGLFTSGKGTINQTSADWNWEMKLVFTSKPSTVKRITVIHNTTGEVWSTGFSRYLGNGADLFGYNERPYPLVLMTEKAGAGSGVWYQINNSYDQELYIGGADASINIPNVIRLYGQKESEVFTGGKLVVEFADGSISSAVIPSLAGPSTTEALLTGLCYTTTVKPVVGQTIYWQAAKSGGTEPYTYSWSGAEGVSGSHQYTVKTYATAGTKSVKVKISSAQQTVTAECSTVVASPSVTPTSSTTAIPSTTPRQTPTPTTQPQSTYYPQATATPSSTTTVSPSSTPTITPPPPPPEPPALNSSPTSTATATPVSQGTRTSPSLVASVLYTIGDVFDDVFGTK